MAYDIAGLACISVPAYTAVPSIWGYVTTDTIATVSGSGYFDDEPRLAVNDAVRANCADGTVWLRIAALNPTTTVVDTNAVSNLLDGRIWVGNAANAAVAVTMSGDATMTNAGVVTVTGIPQAQLKYATVNISAAEFNGAYAAPKLLVAAGGANTLLVLDKLLLAMTYNSAAFAAGGVAAVQYDSTANGAGVIASSTLAAATFQAAASTSFTFNPGVVALPFTTTVNKGLYLSNITGAFTTGNSPMVAHVWYKVIPTV
jgi:hypothetical protein